MHLAARPGILSAMFAVVRSHQAGGFMLAVLASLTICQGATHASIPALLVDGMRVDSRDQTLPAKAGDGPTTVRLAPGSHQLWFSFGPPGDAGPPLRLRYQLVGHDPTWREAGGEMRLTLMVFNAAGEVLGLHESAMRGQSSGWSNTLTRSQFTQREDFFGLPPDAAMLRLIFNSGTWDTRDGASHPTVGFAAIDDCRLWINDAAGQRKNVWPNSEFSEGEELDLPTGRPLGWTRAGMGRKIPQVLQLPHLGQGHVLALVDDNFRSGGEWRCDFSIPDSGMKGGRVDIEWKEMFTVGAAGGNTAEYPLVPPGNYLFHVWGVTPTGEPTGHEALLAVSIPEVFWKTIPFLVASGSVFAIVIAGVARAVTRRRMQHELTRLEQQRTLERERTRIARDIHDDLGTSLTRIALLCQSIRSAVTAGPATAELDQICDTSQELTRKLEEIVWAVDPAHDSLDGVANYLGRFAQDFLSTAGISCRLDLPVQLPSQPISAEVRHNLFLAFKEALNNAVRHSGAGEVRVSLSVTDQQFTLAVADDGKGMTSGVGPSPARGGHGLTNIHNRLAQIGGTAEVTSQPGHGTEIRLVAPLPAGSFPGRQN